MIYAADWFKHLPSKGVLKIARSLDGLVGPLGVAYAFDNHPNGAYSTVAVAPVNNSALTLTVNAGEGVLFPDPASVGQYNISIWPAGIPYKSNAGEIWRLQSKSGDVLTTTARQQESSSLRTILVGDQVIAPVTQKVLTDIETWIGTKTRTMPPLPAPVFLLSATGPTLAGVGLDSASTTVPAWAFPSGTGGVATMINLPIDWNGGAITVQLIWAPSTTNVGTVAWLIDATTLAPGDLIDKAIVSANSVTPTTSGTAKAYQTPTNSQVSFTPVNSFFRLLVYRNGGSFTGAAWLLAVIISYTASY